MLSIGDKFEFEAEITDSDRLLFAKLSGDWNPLHTDEQYADSTDYGSCILHGAYSAGLLSRMAGMFCPGEACLLHGLNLKFLAPILTPALVRVVGVLTKKSSDIGEVDCTVEDAKSGSKLVQGSYLYGMHTRNPGEQSSSKILNKKKNKLNTTNDYKVIVTGASGGLGSEIMGMFSHDAISLRHNDISNLNNTQLIEKLNLQKGGHIDIVHCAWPSPSNVILTEIHKIHDAVQHQLSSPIADIIRLANFMSHSAAAGSTLVLIGSTSSDPGSHLWRNPLYSLAKGLTRQLTHILAKELAPKGIKVVAIKLDLIDGGMNKSMSLTSKQQNSDRTLTGVLPTMTEIAEQIEWVLRNKSRLISGTVIDLTGGAFP